MEVGCGVGNSTIPLLEINQNLRFYSFDFSLKALEFLVEKIQQSNIEEKVNVLLWNPVSEIAPTPLTFKNHRPNLPEASIIIFFFIYFFSEFLLI